jgi:hypothetical protein
MKKQIYYDVNLNIKIDRDFMTRLKYFSKEHNRYVSEVIRTGVLYYILLTEQKETEVNETQKRIIEKMVQQDIQKLNEYREKHPKTIIKG